jgi:hypothetical protein
MARLFISHSSRNDDKAIEVRDWLAKNGWDDVFLDLDPERGIVAGQRWKDALQNAAQRCEMVLALISAEWLASPWCKAEIDAARLMGKKVIVALIGIDKAQVPPDLNDEQWIDLTGDPNAYTRLREGLRRGGLDPTSFPFEAGRRPYPGFAFFIERTEDGLVKIFAALRDIAQVPGDSGEAAPPPTVVLTVDQGEELFNEDGRDEARRFIEILAGTLKADPQALAIMVMRSDSFPQLQTEAQLATCRRTPSRST